MQSGEDLTLDGPVTDELAYQLNGDLQHAVATIIPSLYRIAVHTPNVQPPLPAAEGVATGFSAGIDSFTVMADHHYAEVPDTHRVTHLLYNNVGSHLSGAERLFRERYNRLLPLTRAMGLPFAAVNSNLAAFHRLRFEQTHTLRNTSVAFLLQGGIGRFLYASAVPYGSVMLRATGDIAYADPIVLPLVSTRALQSESSGSSYRRVDKTMLVAGINDSYSNLDVCADGDKAGNCSRCWKCMRTMLTLEIGGQLEQYDQVFDLDLYHRGRVNYMARVLIGQDSLLREIRTFAKERGFSFPVAAWAQTPSTRFSPGIKSFVVRTTTPQMRQRAKRAIGR